MIFGRPSDCWLERRFGHIEHQLQNIMSKISDFASAMQANNDKIDKAIDGLTADVSDLKSQIATLQGTSGEITAEDQALLDGIQTKAGAVADKLAALDSQTEQAPVVPTDAQLKSGGGAGQSS